MSGDETTGDAAPRLRGDAAWKAQRDSVDQQNAAAKKRAHERRSASDVAAVKREHRLELEEQAQLRALNERLDSRR